MNIRLFLLLVCLVIGGIVNDICANRITLRDKWGHELVYDTIENEELLGIPGVDIDDTVVYGFVIKAQESPIQFINKCDWLKCMAGTSCRSNWLNSGMLPSGSIAKCIRVYKSKDGVYRLRKTISAILEKRRRAIVPMRQPGVSKTVLNNHVILQHHHAAASEEQVALLLQRIHGILAPTPDEAQHSQHVYNELYTNFMNEEHEYWNSAQSSNDEQSSDDENAEQDGNYDWTD